MTIDNSFYLLGLIVAISPAILMSLLGIRSLVGRQLSERATAIATEVSVLLGLSASLCILALMLVTGERHVEIELGNWVVLPLAEHDFHFHLKFVFDRLSVPFTILSFVLCGTIGAFTSRYLHREPGYNRFFVLYSIFLLGMIVSSLAGTIETLFFGWEFVGLSSALLVAFFQERSNPIRNGLNVWVIYRIADAAFLIAALTLHHLTGEGDFSRLTGTGPWPEGQSTLDSSHAFFVGLLLLFAAMGKSALVPFSGWLPRAMEGPTSSSAIFYGALSVHLGAYLLLRVGPILEASFALSVIVVAVGLVSALFGAFASRVQTDIKCALAFASLTQVGIIVVEIGCGLRYLALIHLVGHACMRALQLLRAPSLLHDYRSLENALGGHILHQSTGAWFGIPSRWRLWMHRVASERGFLDAMLQAYIVEPFVSVFRICDSLERKWNDWLSGAAPGQQTSKDGDTSSLEEFL